MRRRDAITFKPDRRAIRKMARAREMEAVVADRAEIVAEAARALRKIATDEWALQGELVA